MAKQSGLIQLKGRMGNVSFFENEDGFQARHKKGGSVKGLATDPNYARTRENLLEFARAGKACKLIRELILPFGKKAADSRMFGRLMREMRKVFVADVTSERGLRNVIDGDVELLNGFNFNIKSPLSSVIAAPFSATIDRESGKAQVEFPAFLPENVIREPKSATHFQLRIVGAELDFETGNFKIDSKMSEEFSLTENPGIQLVCQLPADSTHPLFLVLSIRFFMLSGGRLYQLHTNTGNPVAIVQVNAA